MNHPPITVVLLGLTGFGNTVLEALLAVPGVNVAAVFTHRYDGPFPYYSERQLVDLCGDRGVPCHHDAAIGSDESLARLRALAPDLILVATFKEILGERVLAVPPLGVVNLHPSLLPRYRGPCPTNAALLSDDDTSGVTAHYVTRGVDDGDVILQRQVAITEVVDDGQLRLKLARLAGDMIPELLALWRRGTKPEGTPQDARRATYAPRPRPEDGFLERLSSAEDIRRTMRALNPLPGTSIATDDGRIAVDRFEPLADSPSAGPRISDEAVDLTVGATAIRLFRTPRLSAPMIATPVCRGGNA